MIDHKILFLEYYYMDVTKKKREGIYSVLVFD